MDLDMGVRKAEAEYNRALRNALKETFRDGVLLGFSDGYNKGLVDGLTRVGSRLEDELAAIRREKL